MRSCGFENEFQIRFWPTYLGVLATAGQWWLCVGPSDRCRRGVLSPTVVHVHTQHIRCMCLKVSCLHKEAAIVC